MDWKEFYRFTWAKLILFMLLSVIMVLFLLYSGGVKDSSPSIFVIVLLVISFWPFLVMLGIEKLIFSDVDWIHLKDVPFILVALVINVIYFYSIVCLIVFIFRKCKKLFFDRM